MTIRYRNHTWFVTEIFEEVNDETRVELSSPTQDSVITWLNTQTLMSSTIKRA